VVVFGQSVEHPRGSWRVRRTGRGYIVLRRLAGPDVASIVTDAATAPWGHPRPHHDY
jgi:hypothetical protein